MDHKTQESYHFFPDALKAIAQCPICQAKYEPFQAKVLEEGDGAHLVHVECTKCHGAVVAVIMSNQLGLSSVGMITDLTSQDVLRLKGGKPVSEDTVLDCFALLSGDPERTLRLLSA